MQTDKEFFESLDPKIRTAIEGLDALLKTDPADFKTVDLVQLWATLDYAHALMRTTVYSRPDVGDAMGIAMASLQSRGVISQ